MRQAVASGVTLEHPIAKLGGERLIGTKTITKVNDECDHRWRHDRAPAAAGDTRKWALSKALPKIYGDKLEVDNKHTIVEGPIDEVELAKRITFVFNTATAKLDREGPSKGQGSGASAAKH